MFVKYCLIELWIFNEERITHLKAKIELQLDKNDKECGKKRKSIQKSVCVSIFVVVILCKYAEQIKFEFCVVDWIQQQQLYQM